jgi:hypothetical protein
LGKHFQKILLSLDVKRLRNSSSPGQGGGKTYYFLCTLRSTEVIENPFAKFLEMHFQKFKIHLQKLKIISEIHGNAFAKSMIFFTVKHFLNAFPKPQNQNAFFFSRE